MSAPALPLPETWSRVVLTSVSPQVDGGRWPIQRARGQVVEVEAGVVADSHEKLAVELEVGHAEEPTRRVPMPLRWNDEYRAAFVVEHLGRYRYRVHAWLDRFGSWQDQFRRRVEGDAPEQELHVELQDGARLARRAAERAEGPDRARLERLVTRLEDGDVAAALEPGVPDLVRAHAPRDGLVTSPWLEVRVDPELAAFAAWYEFFPRSAGDTPGRHATLDDAAERLEHVRRLGFDVVYLPPIHPIGTTFRKGKDNSPTAQPGEPGSPWAIGAPEGGHTAVAPELGGMEAFERFVARAEALGLKVALDIAFQTSPDHPYVQEHPAWFRHRADGTIRYAENPPKKYQDVYPLDFESEDWRALWQELHDVFVFWIERGVRVFRVDNPHTKPFAFWEWCLGALRARYPDVIFLSEAFARPKTMYGLAKLGFNNSYTYFAWRNTKRELESYCHELFHTDVVEYFRPSFWPNTPDILTEYLAHGGRPAHVVRLVLAATLSPVYGLYGPPFEHVDARQHPAREEYRDNEKYEIRTWNWNDPTSLQPLIRRINRIRRENPAFREARTLRFHPVDNPNLIAYTKEEAPLWGGRIETEHPPHEAPPPRTGNLVLCVVNLDPYQRQEGRLELPLAELGLREDEPFEVHDLLGGERYRWHGAVQHVALDPHTLPAHVFRVHRHRRTEHDFDYFA